MGLRSDPRFQGASPHGDPGSLAGTPVRGAARPSPQRGGQVHTQRPGPPAARRAAAARRRRRHGTCHGSARRHVSGDLHEQNEEGPCVWTRVQPSARGWISARRWRSRVIWASGPIRDHNQFRPLGDRFAVGSDRGLEPRVRTQLTRKSGPVRTRVQRITGPDPDRRRTDSATSATSADPTRPEHADRLGDVGRIDAGGSGSTRADPVSPSRNITLYIAV